MELLNCKEAQRMLRLSKTTILEMLRNGELRGFVRKRAVRIELASVNELIGATQQAVKRPEP